eukprot:10626003-Lingulodinium_polyedra.AAC.1
MLTWHVQWRARARARAAGEAARARRAGTTVATVKGPVGPRRGGARSWIAAAMPLTCCPPQRCEPLTPAH